MANQEVSFTATLAERDAVTRIAERGLKVLDRLGVGSADQLDIEMDLIATHANGNPLDFAKLEGFDDLNLMHDLGGISRHLDRNTGKLGDCFRPRCSRAVEFSA